MNLLGVLRVTHAFLPAMIERDGGRIVNVASEAGRVGSNGSAAYSAAKGGRDQLHEGDRPRERALRHHLQRGRAGAGRHAAC